MGCRTEDAFGQSDNFYLNRPAFYSRDRRILIPFCHFRQLPVEESRKSGTCAVLESFLCFDCHVIVADKIFEESCQLVNRYIATIGLGEKGELSYRTILIEVEIDPKLDPFNIKVQVTCIIFNVHQDIGP